MQRGDGKKREGKVATKSPATTHRSLDGQAKPHAVEEQLGNDRCEGVLPSLGSRVVRNLEECVELFKDGLR